MSCKVYISVLEASLFVARRSQGASIRPSSCLGRNRASRRLGGFIRGLLAVSAALLAPLHSAAAQAQASTGVIRGTVRDAGGSPVAEAVVEIAHRETGLLTAVRTTPSGDFARRSSRSAPTT